MTGAFSLEMHLPIESRSPKFAVRTDALIDRILGAGSWRIFQARAWADSFGLHPLSEAGKSRKSWSRRRPGLLASALAIKPAGFSSQLVIQPQHPFRAQRHGQPGLGDPAELDIGDLLVHGNGNRLTVTATATDAFTAVSNGLGRRMLTRALLSWNSKRIVRMADSSQSVRSAFATKSSIALPLLKLGNFFSWHAMRRRTGG
jgi:hypothetical protein